MPRSIFAAAIQERRVQAAPLGRWPDENGPLFHLSFKGNQGERPMNCWSSSHLPLPPYIERQQNAEHDPDEKKTASATTDRVRGPPWCRSRTDRRPCIFGRDRSGRPWLRAWSAPASPLHGEPAPSSPSRPKTLPTTMQLKRVVRHSPAHIGSPWSAAASAAAASLPGHHHGAHAGVLGQVRQYQAATPASSSHRAFSTRWSTC